MITPVGVWQLRDGRCERTIVVKIVTTIGARRMIEHLLTIARFIRITALMLGNRTSELFVGSRFNLPPTIKCIIASIDVGMFRMLIR